MTTQKQVSQLLRDLSRDDCMIVCSAETGVSFDKLRKRYKMLPVKIVRECCASLITVAWIEREWL